MTEEITASQEPTEVIAPQEQTTTETVQEPQADVQTEQTSEVEASTDDQVAETATEPDTYVYTYKSKEEAEQGNKAKNEYIEKLKSDLQAKQQAEQEVYKQLGYQNELQFKNAQVEQQLSGQYQNDTAMIQNAYNTDLITLNNALDNGQLSEYDYQNHLANLEQQKNTLYESHKDHKELIDLFYDPQPTIEKAIAMKQAIATQAVESYKASLQATEQNKADIAKLPKANGATVDGQPKTDYSASELTTLAETDPEAFAKWCRS